MPIWHLTILGPLPFWKLSEYKKVDDFDKKDDNYILQKFLKK